MAKSKLAVEKEDTNFLTYSYYVRLTGEMDQLAYTEIQKGYAVKKALSAVYREVRQEWRTKRREWIPGFAETEDAYVAVLKLLNEREEEPIKQERKTSRKRKVAVVSEPEYQLNVLPLAQQKEVLRAKLAELREVAKSDPRLKELSKEHLGRIYKALGVLGKEVYWGTFDLIKDAVDASDKACRALAQDIQDKPFTHDGSLGVRWNKARYKDGLLGIPVEALFQPETRLQLTLNNPDQNWGSRSACRQAKAKFRMRLGLDKKGPGAYIEGSIRMHRPLPPGCRIIRASLVSTKKKFNTVKGSKERGYREWSLQICVSGGPKRVVGPLPEVCISLNPKYIPYSDRASEQPQTARGISMGVAQEGSNFIGTLELPWQVVSALGHTDELRHICDMHYNDALGKGIEATHGLIPAIKKGIVKPEHFPVSEEGKTPRAYTPEVIGSWHSHKKLHYLLVDWRQKFLPNSEELWGKWCKERLAAKKTRLEDLVDPEERSQTLLEDWNFRENWIRSQGITDDLAILTWHLEVYRKKIRHLVTWADAERERALARKKDIYRSIARGYANRYARLVLNTKRWSEEKKQAEVTNEQGKARGVQTILQLSAPYELELALIQAFGPSRCQISKT